MKIVLGQINPTVGDILGNYKKIVTNISKFNNKADLIIFPELSISGYPLEDLVLKDSFLKEISSILRQIRDILSQKKYSCDTRSTDN